MGEALRVSSTAPLNPVRPAGALGSRVRRAFRGSKAAPVVVRSDGGRCPIRRQERQMSETPVGLSQPTAQMVLTRVVLAATSEPFGARRDRPRSD